MSTVNATHSFCLRLHRASSGAFLLLALSLVTANATENGISIYPVGAETVLPGVMPPAGKTLFAEFDDFYQANGLMDGNGRSVVPGFHVRVGAVAGKLTHNWGVKFLGGELATWAALPVLYEHLDGPFGNLQKTGVGNPDIGVLSLVYHRSAWHWWYGVDTLTPGWQYKKTDILNVGQHNYAVAADGAFSYLPQRGATEVSSKIQYIVNYTDGATDYRSGGEFIWEYNALHNITKKLSFGVDGYYYQQLTDDRQGGVDIGNRGRVLAVGPEFRYHIGKVVSVLKYQKETLVENRTRGGALWAEFGVPLWHHED